MKSVATLVLMLAGKVWNEIVIVEKIEFSDGSKWEQTRP